MTALTVQIVNAFTGRRALGNPAGVHVGEASLAESRMQAVAREVGHSETAFLWPEGEAFRLRWFTPEREIPLCGHATLASAHVLWQTGRLPAAAPARFQTLSGLLTATREGPWIELDFPAAPPTPDRSEAVIAALGGGTVVGMARSTKWIVELGSEREVRALRPDHAALKQAAPTMGVGVTARGEAPFDYVCRYFADYAGVPEDPVTGSVQCVLAPYWARKSGRKEFSVFQASTRGGVMRVRLEGERVRIAGRAEAAGTVECP